MPTWSQVLDEIGDAKEFFKGKYPVQAHDYVRRRYLGKLRSYTKRDTILYASAWVQRPDVGEESLIGIDDIQALMEVSYGLRSKELDIVLHSPGGSPEGAEAVISYLRSRFDHIRVIVPNFAMSAATMVACAADEIVMGKHSFLGPIDPQITLDTGLGRRPVAAQAVLSQFDIVQRECADPENRAVWEPMRIRYEPDLLVVCEHAIGLSEELVSCWLKKWMFKRVTDSAKRDKKAKAIAKWLSDRKRFKSHSRYISREEIEKQGMKIIRLEDDPKLQDLALSVFHATTLTFSNAPIEKIVENHEGRCFITVARELTAGASERNLPS